MARAGAICILSLLLLACGDEPPAPPEVAEAPAASAPPDHLPHLTDAHLPPLLAGLVPGTSTAEDVLARFPDLETDADRSLGGDMSVQYNGHPAVALRLPYKVASGPRGREDGIEELNLFLVPDDGGVPRIRSMRLVLDPGDGPSLCEWLHEAVGSDPQAKVCRGTNRVLGRVGKSEDAGTYCIGTPDGKRRILVECRTTTTGLNEIEYDLLGPSRRQ